MRETPFPLPQKKYLALKPTYSLSRRAEPAGLHGLHLVSCSRRSPSALSEVTFLHFDTARRRFTSCGPSPTDRRQSRQCLRWHWCTWLALVCVQELEEGIRFSSTDYLSSPQERTLLFFWTRRTLPLIALCLHKGKGNRRQFLANSSLKEALGGCPCVAIGVE